MKAFAAFFIFALCNSAIFVQAKVCIGWGWRHGCIGLGWRSARLLNVLNEVVNKTLEGSRQNVANLHLDDIDLGKQGSIQDVTLKNLETFQVIDVQLGNILALEVKNLSVSIDLFNIEGSYNLINLEVPSVGSISGSGNFSIDLINVNISAALSFKPDDETGKIFVKDISNITVTVDAALAVLEEVEGGDVVNDALSSVIPDEVRDTVPQLLENNKQTLINFLNKVLNNID